MTLAVYQGVALGVGERPSGAEAIVLPLYDEMIVYPLVLPFRRQSVLVLEGCKT